MSENKSNENKAGDKPPLPRLPPGVTSFAKQDEPRNYDAINASRQSESNSRSNDEIKIVPKKTSKD